MISLPENTWKFKKKKGIYTKERLYKSYKKKKKWPQEISWVSTSETCFNIEVIARGIKVKTLFVHWRKARENFFYSE